MKNIDFLPDIYRKREALRRARVWWAAVVVIFSTAIGLSATAQYLMKRGIQQELDDIKPQFAAAQVRAAELANLHSQIAKSAGSARLVTWLEHPWPRSQLVAQVVAPLPEEIRLTEIHVFEESVEVKSQPQAGPRRRGKNTDDEEGPKLPPVEQDLERLRSEAATRQTVVQVTGVTGDAAAVHAYVSELNGSTLFSAAQITTLESVVDANQVRKTTFSVRIVVRPGYGQSEEAAPGSARPAVEITTLTPVQDRLARGGARP